MKFSSWLVVGLIAASAQAAVAADKFVLKSADIAPNAKIADKHVYKGFGCEGGNVSPALEWSGAPAGTRSFAVTVYDPDAPTGSGWWHWVVFNIPASTTKLDQGVGDASGARLPAGAVQSRTDYGEPRIRRPLSTQGSEPHEAAPLHLHGVRADRSTNSTSAPMTDPPERWWASSVRVAHRQCSWTRRLSLVKRLAGADDSLAK